MFKSRLAPVLIVVMAAAAVAACSTVAPSPSMQKTALWKVTSAHRTLYITGDMNVSLKKYPVPAAITHAFAESGELVLEGDPNPDKAKVMPLVMKYGLQPSGQKLSDELDASQSKLVKKAFSSVDVPFASMQHFRPWLAVATLGNKEFAKLGIKPHQLYLHFYHQAKGEKMPVTFLDTAAEELELLAGMPQNLQVALLMQAAKGVLKPKNPDKRAQRAQEWRSGETKPLAKFYDGKFKGYPQLYNIMVTSRHPRWIKTLEAKLAKSGKPVFVIVGAPHLFGPGNLLNGLRKAGYHVSQL